MSKKQITLQPGPRRALLSDTLPFETPPTFSNRHFYAFLEKYRVFIDRAGNDYVVSWEAKTSEVDLVLRLLFGQPSSVVINQSTAFFRGKRRHYRHLGVPYKSFETIPFRFRIDHKEKEARELTIVHPRSQLMVSTFVNEHASAIIYASSLSKYSIRKPVSQAKSAYFKDKTHYILLSEERPIIEEDGTEYEQFGSYFVYRDFSNIHKFYESTKFHACEKRFNKLLKLDISKCFDSLYTHSAPWSVLGKEETKLHLKGSKGTFVGKFDSIMQLMNRNETNGIVVGPEFSRVFSEIILQRVDTCVWQRLNNSENDYGEHSVFRYMDDYFVFYDEDEFADQFIELLSVQLREVKLNLNASKTLYYSKPIVTPMTMAKDLVTTLLDGALKYKLEAVPISPAAMSPATEIFKGSISLNSNKLITKFKVILDESGASYAEILNYALSVVERLCGRIVKDYYKAHPSYKSKSEFVSAIKEIVEFVVFIYTGSPKVNHTIRLCRILNIFVETLTNESFGKDLRDVVFKSIHDNLIHLIKKFRIKEHKQIETLYLLASLGSLGRDYWVDESILDKYISGATANGGRLNYLAITSILYYIDRKVRYSPLRAKVESLAIAYVTERHAYLASDTECLLLFLDLMACPHVSAGTKAKLLNLYGLAATDGPLLTAKTRNWFTSWRQFNLGLELDSKKSREVY